MFNIKWFVKTNLQYFIYFLIFLGGLYFLFEHKFVLGLIIGTTASVVNLFVWEFYLNKAKKSDTMIISTGNWIRYLVAVVACCFWVKYPLYIDIIGILIGLMITYVVIMSRSLQNLD